MDVKTWRAIAARRLLMGRFVQVIEWKTSKIDEVLKFLEEWRQSHPDMGPTRVLLCGDRDNQGSYMNVVEFESYEAAMKNNEDPATQEFAQRLASLADGSPTFHNMDVVTAVER
jgi:hypothetical protein